MRYLLILSLVILGWSAKMNGQTGDPVLFTVDGQAVNASEFSYIYSKNNREDADFSEKSLREYLDLYTRFKLKVREAYTMRLDTVPQLMNELNGYRKQLAESYLTDKEITERLVQEAYARMAQDIHVAHILIKSNPNVATDTMAAYLKIQTVYQRLQAGEDWDQVLRSSTEDMASRDTGGDIGYLTALLPSGFYAFENAAYETPEGKYSAPIRTSLGYHIIKVLGKRPARGELEVSHILARVKEGISDADAKKKIDDLYNQLKGGARFDDLARTQSDDKSTADRGGAIGVMTINQFEKAFEEAAFALVNDGDYSMPVRTRLGWHIVRRNRKRPMLTYEQAKRKIETQISKDERIEAARISMVNRIKKEAGYSLDQNVFNQFVTQAGEDLQTYRWQVPNIPVATLMTLGPDKYSNVDFGNYIRNNARTRMSMAKGTPNREILDKILTEFVNEKALFFEEKNLANKYPEFKSLMREYEEGILLFEATKINVWDKASKDTLGLKKFHDGNRMKYMWDERLEVATLTLDSASMENLPLIQKWAAKKSLTVVAAKAQKKGMGVQMSKRLYQKEDALPEGLTWEPGKKTNLPEGRGMVSVDRIVPPTPKSLDEARGYIIADYQDQLEKDWVASLQAKYPVKVNDAVLMGLVKK